MPKKKASRSSSHPREFVWLPFDSWLVLPFFSFGKAKGISRLFLEIEIVLTSFIVAATVVLIILRLLGLY